MEILLIVGILVQSKKENYNAWKDGTAITVWVVSSKDKNKGWMLRCNTISTIIIYDREYLPLDF